MSATDLRGADTLQIRYSETPISAYSIVQTGPKTKLGGEKNGFSKVAYHVGIAGKVKKDPRIPAPSQRRILNTKSGKFFILGINSSINKCERKIKYNLNNLNILLHVIITSMTPEWLSLQSIYLMGHIFGTALGAGAAFTGDIIFLTSVRNKLLSENTLHIMQITSRIIWVGLLILLLSGIGLVSERPEIFLNSQKFWAKMSIIGVIITNGLVFHFLHFPILRMGINKKFTATNMIIKNRTILVLSGAISVLSWTMTIILGVLGRTPFSYLQFLGVYCVLLLFSCAVALMMRKRIIST